MAGESPSTEESVADLYRRCRLAMERAIHML